MAKFYVNAVYDKTLTNGLSYGQSVIGLFKQCSTDGRGNFCGYYASEYYLDTEMYAYYVADCNGHYRPEARINEVIVCAPVIKYHEVKIGSHMWTKVIEANTIDEAIELFVRANWREWGFPFDEPGMIPIESCPGCGQKPSIYYKGGGDISSLVIHFECKDCGIHVTSNGDMFKAAIKWNNVVSKY